MTRDIALLRKLIRETIENITPEDSGISHIHLDDSKESSDEDLIFEKMKELVVDAIKSGHIKNEEQLQEYHAMLEKATQRFKELPFTFLKEEAEELNSKLPFVQSS